ncbi:MAG: DUF1820 family protein [Gammaproteobacteria bacterium]
MSDKHFYKVVFVNRDQVYEVYVKHVYQGEMYGFVVLEEFLFGEKSTIVVDPSEEKLRSEFKGVDKTFIPMHQVIRIDQVKKRGTAKILSGGKEAEGGSKISSLYRPEKK